MAGIKKQEEKVYSANWGGIRKGAGRPFGSTGSYKEVIRNKQIALRVSDTEKQQLEERAKAENLTVSKYIYKILFS